MRDAGDATLSVVGPPARYASLPESLCATLERTFSAIERGDCDSEGHAATDPGQLPLQNTFRGRFADPWTALDHVAWSVVNLYRIVHDRVAALHAPLWDEVLWIRWSWFTTSMGFGVTWRDPARARRVFDDVARRPPAHGRTLCAESRLLSAYFHEDCACWRELPRSAEDARRDPEGLHLLVGDRPAYPGGDSIHIDPIAPYAFRDEDGRCKVKLDARTLAHLRQVFLPGQEIASPFDRLVPRLASARAAVDARNVGTSAELEAIESLWTDDHARAQACLGRAGWDACQTVVDRLVALSRGS